MYSIRTCRQLFLSRICHNVSLFRHSSTVTPITPGPSFMNIEDSAIDVTEEIIKDERPISNTPFAKNLFLGNIDSNIFVFPEISTTEELNDFNHMLQPMEQFFQDSFSLKTSDETTEITSDILQKLKFLGLFRQTIPIEYGGLGFSSLKTARLADFGGINPAVLFSIMAHQNGAVKAIIDGGSKDQKSHYLPRLAGDEIGTMCIYEPSGGSDPSQIATTAELAHDGQHYILNGTKSWVDNADVADIMIVITKSKSAASKHKVADMNDAFIIEKSLEGVTCSEPYNKIGLRGMKTCDVTFKDVYVPIQNALGPPGEGLQFALGVLESGRHSYGTAGSRLLKTLIDEASKRVVSVSRYGNRLKDQESIKARVAQVAVNAYTMESMAYMTAGIVDQYQQPDIVVESAMTKIFSTEKTWQGVNDIMQILGGQSFMMDQPYEKILRDSRYITCMDGSNEVLRLHITLDCLRHAAENLASFVKKRRDFLNNLPWVISNQLMQARNQNKPMLELIDHVHPTLTLAAETLDIRVTRLKILIQKLVSVYKEELRDEQLILHRLADVLIDMYGMTAVLSRASRSLAIGLPKMDHEATLATSFCIDAIKRIDNNLVILDSPKMDIGDIQLADIADEIFSSQGYVCSHPLMRNW